MPEKTPLHPKLFGRIECDGYSVEKVYLETYPGFYLAGNLYRPLGKAGPFPGILNPHGHWENGRLTDIKEGSIPARCINFAKQGMIAFSYDMVGYNDTHFPESPVTKEFYKIHRNFGTNDPANLLWNISLMGLQTWNSIRALDFLESLPEVDKHRLACTGESGGGTQTFILGAIDDRLAAQAPVVMVSHIMQGGCGCENMPGLRVQFSNMEIAAAAVPRPQIMVACTGDWTKTMLTLEGPAIQHIYDLFKAPDKLRYVRFDFNHNYNQTSREAVYQWFDRWLIDETDTPVTELAYTKESDEDLRVFPDGKLPSNAVSQSQLIQYLVSSHQSALDALTPRDKTGWKRYQNVMTPAWARTLQLNWPGAALNTEIKTVSKTANYTFQTVQIHRETESKPLELLHFIPSKAGAKGRQTLVLLVSPPGKSPYLDEAGSPVGIAQSLLEKNYHVAVLNNSPAIETRDQLSIFFNTYNRTYLQNRVGDIVAACQSLHSINLRQLRIILYGTGHAGLWSLLAAPAANGVVSDLDQLDVNSNQTLIAPELFCPGLRSMDSFTGPLILATPNPLLLHNLSPKFQISKVQSTYDALSAGKSFRAERKQLSEQEILDWFSRIDSSK
ncbi:alpha/beta hydrolase family protein [Pedosphaera parvula]|nr:acetylxylan esterase [Pedosphaera parvula]